MVSESKLEKANKIEVLDFIREHATEHQLMALLLDGQLITEDEFSKEILEDRFNASKFKIFIERVQDLDWKQIYGKEGIV